LDEQGGENNKEETTVNPSRPEEETTVNPSRPEEETTYGSWMRVRKPARRKSLRQQNQLGGRPVEEPGLNRGEGARSPG